jgi:hypothetical protein
MDTGAGAGEAKTEAMLACKLPAGVGTLAADAKSASQSVSLHNSHELQDIEGRGRGGLHAEEGGGGGGGGGGRGGGGLRRMGLRMRERRSLVMLFGSL